MIEPDVYVNGLAITPTRLALVALIDKRTGAVSSHNKVARNAVTGRRCTADVQLLLRFEWIRTAADDERTEVERRHKDWTFYRLTDFGRAAIERGRR